MHVYQALSQNIVFFTYFYWDMANNKHYSWEECDRNSRILERKQSALCFVAVIRQLGNVLKEVDT